MLLPMMLALLAPQDVAGNQADLRCMAVFSALTQSASEDRRASLIAGTMYFYGKITGRSPEFDVEAMMIEMLKADPEGTSLEKNRVRCGEELQKHGTYLMAMGEHLIAASKE